MSVPAVIEVTSATFQAEVLDRSATTPVVVDFYADWCGPCRTLGPTLEALAQEADGAWILAKVNTDHAQDVAQCYGIRGIPAVKGFVGGQVVAEFTGVRSRPEVQEWLQQLGPSPADDAVAAAEAALASGDTGAARQHLRYALAHDGGHAAAATLLARTLAESGDDDAFQALLVQLPAATRAEVQRRLGPIRYALHVAARGGEAAVEARASATPGDPAARFDAAMLQVARGDIDGALGGLLALVRSDRSWGDDAARKALLELLPLHPGGDAGARRWRKKLAMALF